MSYTTSNHAGRLDGRLNSTDYVHPQETNLLNIHKAMQYNVNGEPEVRVHTTGVTIDGNVNVDRVRIWDGTNNLLFDQPNNDGEATSVWSVPVENYNMVFNGSTWDRMRGNIANGVLVNISNTRLAISKDGNVNSSTNRIFVDANGTVELGNTSLAALENINATVSGTVTVSSITSNVNVNPITGNVGIIGNTNVVIQGTPTVNIGSIPEVEIKNDSGNAIPITGNVGIVGNVNVTQGTSPWVVTGNVTMTTDANIPPQVMFADTVQMDPTDRLRVSQSGQQWWYVSTVDKDGDVRIIEKFVGTGANSIFVQNLASVTLTSGNTYNANSSLTGTAIRSSRRRHKMFPGISTEWTGIANWDGIDPNVTKRMGAFTNYNGIFFEVTDDLYCVVRRRLTDNTLLETRMKRGTWNGDNLDGTGPSGLNWNTNTTVQITGVNAQSNIAIPGDGSVYRVQYNINGADIGNVVVGNKYTITGVSPSGFNGCGLVTAVDTVSNRANVVYTTWPGLYTSVSSAQMLHSQFHNVYSHWFDCKGSRTGRIRYGLNTDAGKIILHNYLVDGIGTQWENAPALMDRKEIINTGPVSYNPSMTVGGSTINIETTASINPSFGVAQTVNRVAFNKNTDVGNEYALLGLGLRYGEPYQRADLQVMAFQFADLGNLNPQNAGVFQWRLVLNPTLSGVIPSPVNIAKASQMWDYNTGVTATGGVTLIGGYAQGTFTSDVRTALNFLNMGSDIDYTSADVVVLMVKLLVGGTDNSSMMATINFNEDL